MKSIINQTGKKVLAKVLALAIVMMSCMILPSGVADAASKPKLTKTECTILVGKKYDVNVLNKVKKSSYSWSTSNKKVATVTNKGVIKGIGKGTVTITCKIKTPKSTYKLKCKVTIRKGATAFVINNKIKALNVGQKYNLNRTLSPTSSNDITTWTSSNKSIASPDKNGKFTALKTGTVKITGSTLSGKKDSVTIKVVDKEGTVTNQEELNALLGSGASLITIKTTEAVNLVIPSGTYTKQKLVVDAPNADITNSGKFASITIKQIKPNTWTENATGNVIDVLASNSSIVVATGSAVSINVNQENAVLKLENNGTVDKVTVAKKANIAISGTSVKDIPVAITAANVTITSSVPLNLDCKAKATLVLLKGAEATKIQAATTDVIPSIQGDVTIIVTVGTGATATQQTVTGTPIVTPTPDPGTETGTGDSPSTTNDVTVTTNPDGSTTYTLPKSYTELTSIGVNYDGKSYSIDSTTLTTLNLFLANNELALDLWKGTTNTPNTINGQTVTVTGTDGSMEKTVLFTGGQLDGKSYQVTVNGNSSVTVMNPANQVAFTITKGSDDKSLTISGSVSGLTFNPVY